MADYSYYCDQCKKGFIVKYCIDTSKEFCCYCGGTLIRIWKPTAVIIKGIK